MPEIRDVAASSTASTLIFADPDAGKTTFIGSGGKDYKILLIRSPEDKVDSILGSGVKEVIAADHEEMLETVEMLRHVQMDEWDWVWWDCLSMWQDRGLWDVLQVTYDRAGPPGSAARKHRESFMSDKGEYRVNAERISSYVRELSGSEAFHFGITCHPFWGKRLITDDEDVDDDGLQLQPWIQVKGMVSKICGMMNIVGYLDVAERKRGNQVKTYRRIQTKSNPRLYVKNQFKTDTGESIFGDDGIIVNPTLPKLMEAINTRTRGTRRQRTPRRRRSA